ncbi:hypothetical protein P9112_014112 [Eukaryota sp. TZLM1-RC]
MNNAYVNLASQLLNSSSQASPPTIHEQLQSALSVIISPSSTDSERQSAQQFLSQLSSSNTPHQRLSLAYSLLCTTNIHTIFYALSLIQHIIDSEWTSLPPELHQTIFNFLVGFSLLCCSENKEKVFGKTADVVGRCCKKYFTCLETARVLIGDLISYFNLSDQQSLNQFFIIISYIFEHCSSEGTRKEVRGVVSVLASEFFPLFHSLIPTIINNQSVSVLNCVSTVINCSVSGFLDDVPSLSRLVSTLSQSNFSINFREGVVDLFHQLTIRKIDIAQKAAFQSIFKTILTESHNVYQAGRLFEYTFHTKLIELLSSFTTKFHVLMNLEIVKSLTNVLVNWTHHPSQKLFSLIMQCLSEFGRFKRDGLDFSWMDDERFLTFVLEKSIPMIGKTGHPSKLDEDPNIDSDRLINQIRELIVIDFESQDLYFGFLSQLRSGFKSFLNFLISNSNCQTLIRVCFSLLCNEITNAMSRHQSRVAQKQPNLTLHSGCVIKLESSIFILETVMNKINIDLINSSEIINNLVSNCTVLLEYISSLIIEDCFLILNISNIFVSVYSFISKVSPNFNLFNSIVNRLLSWCSFNQPGESPNFPSKNTSSARRKAATCVLDLATNCPTEFIKVADFVIEMALCLGSQIPDDAKLYLYEAIAEAANNITDRNESIQLISNLFSPLIADFHLFKQENFLNEAKSFFDYFGMNSDIVTRQHIEKRSKFYWSFAYIAVVVKRTLCSVELFNQVYQIVFQTYIFLLSLQSPSCFSSVPFKEFVDPNVDVSTSVSDEVFAADYIVLENGTAKVETQVAAFNFVIHHVKGFCMTFLTQGTYKYFIFSTELFDSLKTNFFPLISFISETDLRIFIKTFLESVIFALPSIDDPCVLLSSTLVPLCDSFVKRISAGYNQHHQLSNTATGNESLNSEINFEKRLFEFAKEFISVIGKLFKVDPQTNAAVDAGITSLQYPQYSGQIITMLASLLPVINVAPFTRFLAILDKFFVSALQQPELQQVIGDTVIHYILLSLHQSPISLDIPGELFSFLRDVYITFSYLENPSIFSSPPLPVSVPNVSVVQHYPRLLFQKLVGPTQELEGLLMQTNNFINQRLLIRKFLGFAPK